MKLGIMQPYLFPYLGYFQLIAAVDRFVLYDDVQYIDRGWVNRNNILVNGVARRFTLPLQADSRNRAINQRYIVPDSGAAREKILRQIELAYRKAPFFTDAFEPITTALRHPASNIADFLCYSLGTCCEYLAIDTPFTLSSEMGLRHGLRGQARIIEINKEMKSSHYINPVGGKHLYDKEEFSKQGIRLRFLESRPIRYKQFSADFVPDLSIVDVMMFNSKKTISEFLTEFDLVPSGSQSGSGRGGD